MLLEHMHGVTGLQSQHIVNPNSTFQVLEHKILLENEHRTSMRVLENEIAL
jgi:hypothetical protein